MSELMVQSHLILESSLSLNQDRKMVLLQLLRMLAVQQQMLMTDFVRKKSMNSTYVGADSSPVVSSVIVDKSDPVSQCTRNDGAVKCNGDVHWVTQSSRPAMDAEEGAAFVHSLGWEPNARDDEVLSEEETNAFFQEYIKLRPASKLSQSLWSNIVTKSDPQSTCSGGAYSKLSPADSTH